MIARRGYTLVEMVAVITILSILGMVSSYVILESMKVYARAMPAAQATYQARFAVERMKSDLRDLQAGSITTFTSTALAFQTTSGQTLSFSLSGSSLLRNGDCLAKGVTALVFRYWAQDGTVAAAAVNVNLIEIDLTVQVGNEPYRLQTAVFPRSLGT